MADQRPKVPPRRGADNRRARAPARKRARRDGRVPRRYIYMAAAVVVIVAVVVAVVVTTAGGGSSNGGRRAVGYTLPDGTRVYGALGFEKVPLEVGPPLAPPNTGLTGATIDGIQCNNQEQLAYHHHVHLAIFVNGKSYSVPLGVGMVPPVEQTNTPEGPVAEGSGTCLYWTHVHAQDGIIHIESPEVRDFELGQVMDVWHVTLSPTQLGSFSGKVTATVNGSVWPGDPRQIPLQQHAQIVLNVGGPVINPPPISWSGTGL